MKRAVEAWERFWFERVETSTLALVRIAFGTLALGWTLALAPDLFTFFSSSGLIERQPAGEGWGILAYFPGDAAVVALYMPMFNIIKLIK